MTGDGVYVVDRRGPARGECPRCGETVDVNGAHDCDGGE